MGFAVRCVCARVLGVSRRTYQLHPTPYHIASYAVQPQVQLSGSCRWVATEAYRSVTRILARTQIGAKDVWRQEGGFQTCAASLASLENGFVCLSDSGAISQSMELLEAVVWCLVEGLRGAASNGFEHTQNRAFFRDFVDYGTIATYLASSQVFKVTNPELVLNLLISLAAGRDLRDGTEESETVEYCGFLRLFMKSQHCSHIPLAWLFRCSRQSRTQTRPSWCLAR